MRNNDMSYFVFFFFSTKLKENSTLNLKQKIQSDIVDLCWCRWKIKVLQSFNHMMFNMSEKDWITLHSLLHYFIECWILFQSDDHLISILVSHCMDGIKNRGETDIDCGGIKCPKCEDMQTCKDNCDCISEICKKNVCIRKYRTFGKF